MDPRRAIPVGAALVLALLAPLLRAGAETETQELLPTNPYSADYGAACSLENDWLVVGAPHELEDLVSWKTRGLVYVYRRQGSDWVLFQQLLASDWTPDNEFGSAVSLSGDVLVVGAHMAEGVGVDDGAAYVYRFDGSTWNEEQKLVGSGGMALNLFGWSVAASGDSVVVGAPGESGAGLPKSGSAHVFRWDGQAWAEQQTLVAADGAVWDYFGLSIAMDGHRIVVGAPMRDMGALLTAGAAYVFDFDGALWFQQQQLLSPAPEDGESFGQALAVDGDLIAAGAPGSSAGGPTRRGTLYPFAWDGSSWNAQTLVQPALLSDHASLGQSVALSGETMVAGAPGDDLGTLVDAGACYAFAPAAGVWTQSARMTASDAQASDLQGFSVAVAGDAVAAGATWYESQSSVGLGKAYAFCLLGDAWSCMGHALGGTHGLPAATGSGSLMGGTPVTVQLEHALENSTAWFVAGAFDLELPFKGGVLVPDPSPPGFFVPLSTDVAGQVTVSDVWPSGLPPGLKLYLQWWISDPLGPRGFAASNGLVATTP